jgi:hypothetical protein
MSFFSGLLSSLTGGDILRGAATLGGAFLGANANERASDARTDAAQAGLGQQLQFARESRDLQEQARQRGLAAIDAGTQRYADTTAPLRVERPITLPTYRGLTTQQQIGLEDLRRDDNARLAATGMRGAGRAGVASVLDRDRRFMAGARAQNDADTLGARRQARSSADAATANLGQVYAQEGGAKANVEIGQGNNMAQSLRSDGTAAMQTANAIGGANAAADLSSGQIYQSALNSLGGIFANANAWKPVEDARKSSYDNMPKV